MAGRTRLLVLFSLVLAVGGLPSPARADLKAGREALQRGDWGAFEKAGAPELTDLGIAAHTLEMWQDANDQLRLATEKDPAYLRANLEWGDLFQEKYRPGEAQKSYEAVLKINPNHPLALLGMA